MSATDSPTTYFKKSITDLAESVIADKRVLVRVDFNVPLDSGGTITDDSRIRQALPTIRFLLERGGKVILISHLGRPKGKVDESLRMTPIGARLSELLEKPVSTLTSTIGPEVTKTVSAMAPGDIILLENVRFCPQETQNDPLFSRQLAQLADIFVSDAFGVVHRAHASNAGVAKYLMAVSGLLIGKELTYLDNAIRNPQRPFAAIIGGAKVSSKISVLQNLLDKVDTLIIGGAMTYTFLKAAGSEIGKSLCETDKIDVARQFLESAKSTSTEVIFPTDHVVVPKVDETAEISVVETDQFPSDKIGVDIGPKTIETIQTTLKDAKTILWNGPMGIFEMDPFAKGTFSVAQLLADSNATTIIGGGDSAAAITKAGLTDKITHISTGGGASLEFLEGKPLPGIIALEDK